MSCDKSSGPARRISSQTYDGKSHPSEFLSIYTIMVQAAGGGTTRSLPTTSRWYSSPTSGPGSCTCRTIPSPLGQIYAISLSAPLQAATSHMAKRAIFIYSPRRKESHCASTFRDSAVYSATSQISTLPRSSARSIRTCVTARCAKNWQ